MEQDYSGIKKVLGDLLAKKQQDKATADTERQARNDGDRNKILENISGDLAKSLSPVLAELAKNSKLSTDDIRTALAEAIQINLPEIKMPDIPAPIVNIPAPIVNVKAPLIPAPVVHVSPAAVSFPSEMSLKPNSRPFPVMMVDQVGKPMQFPHQSGGATGGRGDFFTIKDFQTSTGGSYFNDKEGALRITGSVTTSGSVSSTLAQLVNADGTYYDSNNPLPTTATIALPAGQGDAATATRVVVAGNSDASVVVNSGTLTTVTTLTNITNSVSAMIVDSTGVAYSGSNPLPTTATLSAVVNQGDAATALRVVIAGNSDASVVVNSGTLTTVTSLSQFNGNTPAQGLNETTAGVLRTVTMSDTASSSQAKLIAMTTLPTAAADTASTFQKADKLGRGISRPVQVRDLLATAYVSLTTGTEATLLAAVAGNFLDLVSVVMSNQSTAAVQVDIRATTAGNIVQTFQIPANGTAGVNLTTPWPQDNQGNAWTVDMPDITGTTVNISALFSKEI